MNEPILRVDEIVRAQAQWTEQWHDGPTPAATGLPWNAIEHNHRMNFELWHEEDIARRDDLGPERVRQAKRVIDRCNQLRNDAIEKVDLWLLEQLPPAGADVPLHSETPGMMIDRLSILALKLYHMRIESDRASAPVAQRRQCSARHATLTEQLQDLSGCLETLLTSLPTGRQRFKLYRQFKMYNDANLNPQLYASQPKK
ncbi:MAG: DUF4254 domain-containing protein [Verrucomicrobiota bacterium]